MPYVCTNSDCTLALDELPVDGLCPTCWLPMVDETSVSELIAPEPSIPWDDVITIGLCTLVCDISVSMDEPVSSMATPDPDNLDRKIIPTRLQLVAKNAALGIWDLCGGVSKASDAYLALAVFGETAQILSFDDGKPFVVAASELRSRFEGAVQLGEFLERKFKEHMKAIGGSTNITDGVALANQLYENAKSGTLSKWGVSAPVELIQHDILGLDNKPQTIPNFRTLIYSDGGHNVGELRNAFASSDDDATPWSLLMTAFIGSSEDPGAIQMKDFAGKCPVHGYKNFFLINDPNRFQKLRGLFRMASGASGFCPICLGDQG